MKFSNTCIKFMTFNLRVLKTQVSLEFSSSGVVGKEWVPILSTPGLTTSLKRSQGSGRTYS